MRTFNTLHLWLALTSLLQPAVYAAGSEKTSRNFRVCSHDLPPHSMQLKDGRPGGMASEILLAVTNRVGWKLTINYYPWLRARDEAEKGNCDLIYTILKKNEYEKFAVFPNEHLEDRYNVLVVQKNSGLTFDGNLETFMRQNRVGTGPRKE